MLKQWKSKGKLLEATHLLIQNPSWEVFFLRGNNMSMGGYPNRKILLIQVWIYWPQVLDKNYLILGVRDTHNYLATKPKFRKRGWERRPGIFPVNRPEWEKVQENLRSCQQLRVMPAAAPTERGRGHPGLLQGVRLALPAVHNTGNCQCHLGPERRQRLRTDLWPLSSDCSFTDTLVWDFLFTGETLSQ